MKSNHLPHGRGLPNKPRSTPFEIYGGCLAGGFEAKRRYGICKTRSLKRDFPMYAWSIRSLDRRLRCFEIYYNNPEVSVEEVKDAVKKELEGAGKLLEYRAMLKKVRQEYNLHVTRDAVYNVMYDLDPEGLEARDGIRAKKRRKKGNFSSKGPNFVHSLDGHDKMMGYQNSTFPLAVYGCIDTASRKIMWLRIWTRNSNPKLVGRWYQQHLLETRTISRMIRLEKRHGNRFGSPRPCGSVRPRTFFFPTRKKKKLVAAFGWVVNLILI